MKWKKTLGAAVIGAVVGIIGTAKASPVVDAPPGGGGGGQSFNISESSSFVNNSSTQGQAQGSFDGYFVATDVQSSLSIWLRPDPQPGNLGQFYFSTHANGFIPEPGQDLTQFLNSQLNTNGSLRVNQVTTEPSPDGSYVSYFFNPEFQLWGNGNARLYQFSDSPPFGNFWSNLSVDGGMVTNTSTDIERNLWAGEGEPPPWLSDLQLNFYASGPITAGNFTVVPEPASLVLLGAGAVALVERKRRLAPPRLCKIG